MRKLIFKKLFEYIYYPIKVSDKKGIKGENLNTKLAPKKILF